MANFRISETIRHAMLSELITAIDAGSAGGKIKIYDGTQPASGGTATNLLGTLTFSGTSAAAPSGGVLTFSTITEDSSADASGTATWARVTDSDDNFVFDCDISTAAAGTGMIQLNTTTITSGGPIRITSWTITLPADITF